MKKDKNHCLLYKYLLHIIGQKRIQKNTKAI